MKGSFEVPFYPVNYQPIFYRITLFSSLSHWFWKTKGWVWRGSNPGLLLWGSEFNQHGYGCKRNFAKNGTVYQVMGKIGKKKYAQIVQKIRVWRIWWIPNRIWTIVCGRGRTLRLNRISDFSWAVHLARIRPNYCLLRLVS